MTKLTLNLVLAVALFTGTVFADGNMGDGGYTGCDGSNPPPTCCDVPTPPSYCGGFASTQTTPDNKTEEDFTIVFELIDDFVLWMF
jgi:hypothetical protein